MNRVRIAVSGIGLVTPLGTTTERSWQRLLAGETGVRSLPSEVLGPLYESHKGDWFGGVVELPADQEVRSRSVRFARLAAQQAISEAKLTPDVLQQAACVIGTSKPDLRAVDQAWSLPPVAETVGEHTVPQDFWELLCPSHPASATAAQFQMWGPVLCPVAACATGLVSLIRAAELIRHGDVSTAVAGSVDSSLHPGLLSSYRRLGVLAKGGTNPERACRPFDQTRSGFAVGEGGAAFVLENWDHALQRGRQPQLEWVDGLYRADPSGITAVDESGQTLASLIEALLEKNGLSPRQIQAVSYHGTATMMNDLAESKAVHKVLGTNPLGFGVKGAIGHLMGAAGAVEVGFGLLALRDQVVPPTANHLEHDPECPNRVTSKAAVRQPIEYLLKTSLGFGGHLAVGLLKRVSQPKT